MISFIVWSIVKTNADLLNDDVRRNIVFNFMLTWHKLNLMIGQFEINVPVYYIET